VADQPSGPGHSLAGRGDRIVRDTEEDSIGSVDRLVAAHEPDVDPRELGGLRERSVRETVAIFKQLQAENRFDVSDLEAPKTAPVVVTDEP
jgi:hypothetical protein